jgi:hypothetical protein
MPSGKVRIEAQAHGFMPTVYSGTPYNANHPAEYSIPLKVGSTAETVEVTAAAPLVDASNGGASYTYNGRKDRDEKKPEAFAQNGASQNVLNLQKRVAGVLPVRVDVPRAGNSYRFARALVLDEETKVSFNYRTK